MKKQKSKNDSLVNEEGLRFIFTEVMFDLVSIDLSENWDLMVFCVD